MSLIGDSPVEPNFTEGSTEFSVCISGTFTYSYNITPLQVEIKEALEAEIKKALCGGDFKGMSIDELTIL